MGNKRRVGRWEKGKTELAAAWGHLRKEAGERKAALEKDKQ